MSHSFAIHKGSHNFYTYICKCFQQHHRGRVPRQDTWVFGVVDTSLTPALGNCSLEECSYIASNNSKPCSPRDDHPLGSVAGVQPGGTTPSRLHSPHSQPFPPLRRPSNWRPHPTCGIVLESCEGEAETHEGLPPPPVAGVTSTNLCGGKDMGRKEKRRSPQSCKILHGSTQSDL